MATKKKNTDTQAPSQDGPPSEDAASQPPKEDGVDPNVASAAAIEAANQATREAAAATREAAAATREALATAQAAKAALERVDRAAESAGSAPAVTKHVTDLRSHVLVRTRPGKGGQPRHSEAGGGMVFKPTATKVVLADITQRQFRAIMVSPLLIVEGVPPEGFVDWAAG